MTLQDLGSPSEGGGEPIIEGEADRLGVDGATEVAGEDRLVTAPRKKPNMGFEAVGLDVEATTELSSGSDLVVAEDGNWARRYKLALRHVRSMARFLVAATVRFGWFRGSPG
jgi:hypothetical protein